MRPPVPLNVTVLSFKCPRLAWNFREGCIFHSISFTIKWLKGREGVKADRDRFCFRSVKKALNGIKSLFGYLKRDLACPKNLKTCKRRNYNTSYDSPCLLCQHSLLTLPTQLAYFAKTACLLCQRSLLTLPTQFAYCKLSYKNAALWVTRHS